jgi:hypothetical protein
MDKPTFPKPQLIREDFLPYDPNPMKNYRILKITDRNIRYYPQVRVLWWWHNLFSWNEYYDGFTTLVDAKKSLCAHIKRPVLEYINFDPNEDCK